MSLPAGFTPDGLPVGMEVLGTAFSEPLLLRVAYAYEREARPRKAPALH
jgi:Asp-tRNA(Asn)/Glu-tRNA(Gln) amidotransferase A subunit family amidase